jgi:hypothetical protein
MRQLAIVCCFFLIVLVGTVGCLYIFDVLSFETSKSVIVEFGAAVVLLGLCSAGVMLLLRSRRGGDDQS